MTHNPKGEFPNTAKLPVLKRGDRGLHVRWAQEWLSLHGHRVHTDGFLGPATENAVQEFAGFDVIGKQTWDRLVQPMERCLDLPHFFTGTARDNMSSAIVDLLDDYLEAHPREVGGQNMGPWVRLFMDGNEGDQWPWCAGFVTFVWQQAYAALTQENVDSAAPDDEPFRTFSCDVLAMKAKELGLFVQGDGDPLDLANIIPGDIFLLRGRTPGDWVHTGFVTELRADAYGKGFIKTIEGNTNDDGSREGYEVAARRRGLHRIDFVKAAKELR